MEKEKKELEKIVYRYRNYRNDLGRHMLIWEEIAQNINSNTGKSKKYWNRVMDLYKKPIIVCSVIHPDGSRTKFECLDKELNKSQFNLVIDWLKEQQQKCTNDNLF